MNPDQKNGAAPLFSVITVSFNAMPGLLESVQSLKAQTAHSSAEWVVVDGASTDGSAAWLAAQQPDVFVSEPDRGIYDAMNKAISRASGQWLFFLNAGDTFVDPHVLRDLQAGIAAQNGADIVYGDVVHFARCVYSRRYKCSLADQLGTSTGKIECYA